MKHLYLYLVIATFIPFSSKAQYNPPPCQLEVRTNWGLCLDLPCIPFYATPVNGTPPYQYLWENGSTDYSTLLYSPNIPIYDTCMSVWVTDANGCKAFGSTLFHVPQVPVSYIDTITLSNDTLLIGSSGLDFNVSGNDHPFTRNFILIRPPQHGTLSFNPDGSGHYQPEPGWCEPDYFRYSATDTTDCNLYHMATVMLYHEACAGVYVEKPDCNQSCSGRAVFYQNGVHPAPLSYQWSNGSTAYFAENLCAGQAFVTVTDGTGAPTVYPVNVGGESLTAEILAPAAQCYGTSLQLASNIVSSGGADFVLDWSGYGLYGANAFEVTPEVSLYSDSAKVTFHLHAHSLVGCDAFTTKDLAIVPAPNINLEVIKPKCPGDTLTINTIIVEESNPPYHYSWSGPHGVQSNWPNLIWPNMQPDLNGLYQVTITDASACEIVRSEYLFVPQSCYGTVVIQGDQLTLCSGGELKLNFGWTGTVITPDEITWTGPNGFSSHEASPTLKPLSSSMSGWYYLTVRQGSFQMQDSALFTITPSTLSGNVISTSIPTSCIDPYDGSVTIEMDQAPPYQYSLYSWGSYTNVNSNPFTVDHIAPGEAWVDVKKNGCVTHIFFNTDYPSKPQFEVQEESCAGNDASISILSPNPVTINWTFPDQGYLYDGPSEMTDLAPGTYTAYIQDSLTLCPFNKTFSLEPYLSFDFAVVDTPTCTSSNGVLLALPSANATPPLSFAWNTGSNLNPLDQVPAGGYSLTLTDGNGCHRQRNTVLPPQEACIAQLSGQVRANLSCICNTDNNTVIFPFARVCASDGVHTQCTFTDNTGYYVIPLTETGIYTLHADSYLPVAQGACADKTINITDISRDSSGLDFYFCGASASDRQISGYCGPARPGFSHYAMVQVRNNGFWTADTTLVSVQLSWYMLSPSFTPAPAQYDPLTHIASWVFPKLQLYEQKNITINSTIDPNAPLGDYVTIQGEVSGNVPIDPYADNNQFECSELVTGSHDPNDKVVYPIGLGPTGYIAPLVDSVLTYTIRFQNTGTDTAFTVVVRDTLDEAVFNLESIEPLFSSHPYRLDLEQGNILVFTFNPILLPDSSTSQQGSSGFAQFRIRIRRGLLTGTAIQNSAAIYFDYNQPIITNSASNLIVSATYPSTPAFTATLMPNPSSGQTFLSIQNLADAGRLDVNLFSADGRMLKRVYHSLDVSGTLGLPIATSELPAGVYLVELRSERGRMVLKLFVE